MRYVALGIVFIGMLLAGCGGGGGGGGGGSDEAQIRHLNEQVVKAFNETNPQLFHSLLDSESKKSCPLKEIAGLFLLVKAFAGNDKLKLHEIRDVKVDGNRATATTLIGMGNEKPDPEQNEYIREGGKWHFNLGSGDECGFGG